MSTNITVLLDRSGSMNSCKNDHEGGLKSFVNEQKGLAEDKAKFTLIQFDDVNVQDIVFDSEDIEKVDIDAFLFTPRGSTPLLDAFGKTLARIEEQESKSKSDRVILVIITDGEENASKEWTKTRIKEILDKKKDEYIILFLGTNFDAFGEARSFGIASNFAMNFENTNAGIDLSYKQFAGKLRTSRSMHHTGAAFSGSMCYSKQDYVDMENTKFDNTFPTSNVEVSQASAS